MAHTCVSGKHLVFSRAPANIYMCVYSTSYHNNSPPFWNSHLWHNVKDTNHASPVNMSRSGVVIFTHPSPGTAVQSATLLLGPMNLAIWDLVSHSSDYYICMRTQIYFVCFYNLFQHNKVWFLLHVLCGHVAFAFTCSRHWIDLCLKNIFSRYN